MSSMEVLMVYNYMYWLGGPIEDGPCEDTGVRTFHVTFGSNTF